MAYDVKDIKTAAYFRSDYWDKLTPQQRHQAIIELTEFSAKELGHESPAVVFEPIEGYEAGYQINGTIHLNSNLVDDGRFVFYDGEGNAVSPIQVEHAGAEVMQVVFHEDTHCHQDAVAEGKVDISKYNPQYVRDMSAGGKQSTYIDPNFDYLLYRIQPQELEAFRRGYAKTEEMLRETEKYLGEDPQLNGFLALVSGEEENKLNEAREKYRDPKVEESLGAAIRDKYYGTNDSEQYSSGKFMRSILEASYQYNLSTIQKMQNSDEVSEQKSLNNDIDEFQKETEHMLETVQESINSSDGKQQNEFEGFFSSVSDFSKNAAEKTKENRNDYSY